MTPGELYRDLSQRGIELWVEHQRLRFRAPTGTITPEIRDELSRQRAALIALLDSGVQTGLFRDLENRGEPFPLTDIQQAYWLGRGSAFEIGNVAAYSYVELERDGLDLERARLALQRVVDRHDMLRSVVTPDGRQRILPRVECPPIPVADAARALEIRDAMSRQVLSLTEWPPFDVRATTGPANRVRLHFGLDLMVADAWSLQLFFQEWAAFYNDPNCSLPEIDISYRDYVLACAAERDSARYRRDLDYWRDLAATLPPAPQLPLATAPASLIRPRFTRRTSRLEREQWDAFRACAQRAGLTPSGLLLACFADVIAAWSKSPRFTLNLTLFNRRPSHPHVDRIIGDFTSTILLAVESTQESLGARARAIQERLWRDLEYSSVTGIETLRHIGRLRGPSAASMPIVFTSILSRQKADWSAARTALGAPVYGISQTPQVWLDHQVMELEGALVWNWDAVEDLFPQGMLDAMFEAYGGLLERVLRDPAAFDAPGRRLAPPNQMRQRAEINSTSVPIVPRPLYSAFVENAALHPNAPAVISSRRRITYGELHRLALTLGRHLQAEGAAPNQRIAVMMEKGWEQVVAVLGILYAGAAYLPIDASLPAERIEFLLRNGEVRIVLTAERVSELLDRALPETTWTPVTSSPEDLAYVIYTSGSTGQPKGVMIDHRGAWNTIADINSRFRITPQDRVLALSSLSFDLSVYDIFGTLAAGAAVVLPDADALRDSASWLELLHDEQVTVWNSVPALMEMLVESAEAQGRGLAESLRLVLLSGDWIPLALPGRIRSLSPAAELVSLGGATEASIWSIVYPIAQLDPAWKSIPYGQPMANQQWHVLDEAMEPCPVWTPGELYIGGTGLAQGYWRDAAQTAQRFIYHPAIGERLYRTGDFGRYLPDGNIEFLGRADFQVKVQGHRIELGEIEAALLQHPLVKDAVVAVPETPSGRKQMVAYLVPRECRGPERKSGEWQRFWDAAIEAGKRISELLPPELDSAPLMLSEADALARAYMCRALGSMGAFRRSGESHGVEALADHLGVRPKCRALLARWLDALAAHGFLDQPETGVFRCARPLPMPSAEELQERCADLESSVPGSHILLDYLAKSGEALPALLRGEQDALELFFPGGSSETAESWYRGNPVAEYHNKIAAAALAALAAAWDRPEPVRILEVGAGTGGTTVSLLAAIPPGRFEYTFTDVSNFFLSTAREKFAGAAGVQFGLLDIDRSPQAQGYARHSFDVVAAANVMHDARHLDATLRWVRGLLAPSGVLLLVEGTRNTCLQMASVGFLEGFGRHSRAQPLLSAEEWRQVLTSAGYAGFTSLPDTGSPQEVLGQHVILAQAPEQTPSLDGDSLAAYLRTKLPAYMTPSAFVLLDALPLTENGKVDRKILTHWNGPEPAARVYTPPRNRVETAVAQAWASVLGVERVGIEDNFFELGGDSLLATQLIGRLRQTCGIDLPLRRLFETPTIAGLHIGSEPAPAETALPQVVPAPAERFEPFALTDVQHAYWVGRGDAFALGNIATYNYVEVDVDQLDVERFELAIRCLIARHDMLRAIVRPDGRQQVLAETPAYQMARLDLRSQAPEAVERRLAEVRSRMSHQVLPADCWPLFDIRVSLLGESRVRVHFGYDALIGDALSSVILARELSEFYAGRDRDLPPLELTFRDCVLAEAAFTGSPAWQASEQYWLTRIPGLAPAPALPLAAAPGTLKNPRFARAAGRLSSGQWMDLKQRAAAAGLTPSGVLLAAYAAVIGKWSKDAAFTLNLTLFNRLPVHPQIGDVVGDFTSLLLLELNTSGPNAFERFARDCQQQLWAAMDHRHFSGVRVLRELARAGGPDLAAMPVVFTSAVGLPELNPNLTLLGIPGRTVYGISQTPQVWLDNQAAEHAGGLNFTWDYVEGLFPEGVIGDMFAAYSGLLERLAADSEAWRRPLHLPLPAWQLEERAAANDTAAPLPDGLLHSAFLEQARAHPERLAVVSGSRRISYGKLRRRAHAIARWLVDRGAEPNRLVAVVMEKGWEQVAAVLGVLEAGAAYLPVDAGLPRQRIDYLLSHGEVKLALTQERLGAGLGGIEWLAVDREDLTGEGELEVRASRADLAYVIYTSGSTGQPKGVMIEHGAAVNSVAEVNRRLGMSAGDRVLAVSSLSFDLSVWDIFGTLGSGGAVVIPEGAAERDPVRWVELMASEGVTVWNSVPALMELLMQAEPACKLRVAMLSGDWIPLRLVERMKERGTSERLVSLGGATEASIWSIWHEIGEVASWWKSIPYGRPLANQRFEVLHRDMEECPVWVAGELYIGGAGVARGYWRDEEKTKERFIERGGERLYRTGDWGRRLPGGEIEFLGREDEQVKVQGHRIELGEVTRGLEGERGVREAAVLVKEGKGGGKRLVAYVAGEGLRGENLRAGLGEKLPEYMIPSEIAVVERLPLTANGKVDRKALLEMAGEEGSGEAWVGPRTAAERELARIWAEVLQVEVERVGVHDNFLAAGGDSLLAVQFVAMANRAGCRLTLRDLFRLQNIAGIAAAEAELVPVEPLPRSRPAPAPVRVIETSSTPVSGLPDWEALVSAGQAQSQNLPADVDFASLAQGFHFLDRLSTAYICRCLVSLGAYTRPGESYTADGFVTTFGIKPGYRKLVSRWFGALADDGLLSRNGEEFAVAGPLTPADLDVLWAESSQVSLKVPEAVIAYLKRSGESLAEIITGRTHALEVFFAGGNAELQEWLYQQSPGMAFLNAVAGAVVRAAAKTAGPLNVLEIGAGVGGTTAWLLQAFPPETTTYHYTDLSNYFLKLAQEKFQEFGFLRFGLLNIENDPVAQGCERRAYNLVIAANVLHGVRDLSAALDHVRSLMTPGGVLLLVEGTRNDRLHNFTLGLIEGWSRFEDERLASNLPLLSTVDWRNALAAHGFEDVTVLPEPGSPAAVIGQHVIVSRMPAAVAAAPADRSQPFPLTPVQQAYWLGRSDSFALGGVAAHLYVEIDCHDLDLERFTNAWRTLITRHEMLRAVVLSGEQQRILETAPPFAIAMLRDDPLQIRARMSRQVLPPDHWPLFEIAASPIGPRATRLHISFDLLIADGWSLQLLASELVELYREPERVLEPLKHSFRDYVLAESTLDHSEVYERARRYWLERIPRLPGPPALPLAAEPARLSPIAFERRQGLLDRTRWRRLKETTRSSGLTPSVLLCAAFSRVLSAWSRSPQFTLNLTFFNREPLHPQVNLLVGDFTSLELLEIENLAGSSIVEQARAIEQRLWADLDHRRFGGVAVLREMARQRGAAEAGMPIVFTSALPLSGADVSLNSLGELGRVNYSITQTPQVWLDHQVIEQDGSLLFNWDYVAGLFPEGVIGDMFAAYSGLLETLAADAGAWRRPLHLPLPAWQLEERAAANHTAEPLPEGLLHSAFLEQARAHPERLAVVSGTRRISYGELRRRAHAIARWLVDRGAEPNRLVAVVMEKGWEQVAAVLGVLEAGAAYLPVDAGLPRQRIDYLLSHGEVKLALTQERLGASLGGIEWLAVDREDLFAEGELEVRTSRADLAYVIYTSGSTGQPKGVMIEHGAAVNTVAEVNRRLGMSAGDRVLAVSSLSFDLSVWDIFGTLGSGGAVVIPEGAAERDPVRWVELMARERVTVWNSVPALMELLVQAAPPCKLRVAMLSGDWIPLKLVERMKERGLSERLVSLGGATEASIWSIWHEIGEVASWWKSIPYGRPLANQRFEVWHRDMEECPVWVAGELYIGGAGVARGYWRDEEKTKERFIERGGERLYRTGDWGRRLPGGEIEFLGREDEQVKVQGHRIELGEVTRGLEGERGVREAAVLVKEGKGGGKRLVAYVAGEGLRGEELRAGLGEKLPEYMIPSEIVVLERLPLTANGKVDRRALLELAGEEGSGEAWVGPRTAAERELARIWAEVLQVEVGRVGVHDNFLAAGGDSLLAIQMAARIGRSFDVDLPLRSFFRAPTVAELAVTVEELLLADLERLTEQETQEMLRRAEGA